MGQGNPPIPRLVASTRPWPWSHGRNLDGANLSGAYLASTRPWPWSHGRGPTLSSSSTAASMLQRGRGPGATEGPFAREEFELSYQPLQRGRGPGATEGRTRRGFTWPGASFNEAVALEPRKDARSANAESGEGLQRGRGPGATEGNLAGAKHEKPRSASTRPWPWSHGRGRTQEETYMQRYSFNEAVALEPRKARGSGPWSGCPCARGFNEAVALEPRKVAPAPAGTTVEWELQRGRGPGATEGAWVSMWRDSAGTGFNEAVALEPRKAHADPGRPVFGYASTRPWPWSHGRFASISPSASDPTRFNEAVALEPRKDPAIRPSVFASTKLQRGRGPGATEGGGADEDQRP